jgi:beta-phosphoglucomutase-like phosphatase (HAD superfamily)
MSAIVKKVTKAGEKLVKKVATETFDVATSMDKDERRAALYGEMMPAQKAAMEKAETAQKAAMDKQEAVLKQQEERLKASEEKAKTVATASSRSRRRGRSAYRLLLSPYRPNAVKGIGGQQQTLGG